jgi:hypothetical protein
MDIKKFRPEFLKGKILSSDNRTPRKCRMCPTVLTYERDYCSSACRKAGALGGWDETK